MFQYVITENNPLIKIYTLASCGNDHNIKIWKLTYQVTPKHLGELGNIDVELTNELEGHESAVTCLKYSSNSALLATASLDKTVKIWNTDGECLKSEENHSRYVNCIAFSRDNSLLASGIVLFLLFDNIETAAKVNTTHCLKSRFK